jgi:hypothetical protein
VLHGLHLVKPVVEANYLAYQLGSLGDDAAVDGLVNGFKPIPEGLIQVADPMELSVVWTHHRAVIAKKLLTRVAEELKRLAVKHADPGLSHMRVLETAEWALRGANSCEAILVLEGLRRRAG